MSRTLYDIAPLVPLVESGFVLLTPNFRLARRIKAEWDAHRAASGALVWEPISVLPLESWLQQQWQLAVTLELLTPQVQLSSAKAMQLWQQVITEDEQNSGKYHLLRPAAAAELASAARDTLLRWQVDLRIARLRQDFTLDSDCATFLHWHQQFEQRLSALGLSTALDGIRQLQSCADKLPRARIALLEFDDIPPLYAASVTAIAGELQEVAPSVNSNRRQRYSFPDKRSELQAVAQWAATINRRDPALLVGIVLSDMAGDRAALEYLLRREFACLGEDYGSLPVNFSTGITLDRAPVVRDALGALALAGRRTTVPAVVALLQSRFLHLPDGDTPLANYFITRLFDAGREEVETADLRFAASEVHLGENRGLLLGQYLLTISGMRELRQPALPSQWIDRFCKILAVWGWPGNGVLDSLEYQQVELWYRTLDEFRGYDAVCRPMGFTQVLQLLRNSCTRQMFQPQTADYTVQVLGPLEAAGLTFDHLWLCGMQGGRWPAPAKPNPFIPQALQRRLQMPHATPEREWAFASGLLQQYTRSTTVLHASYCRQLDDVAELPSALLEDFSPMESPATAQIDPAWLLNRQQQLEYLSDELAPVVGVEELADISGGSALLEDQSHCPFRAFARRRLRVEPLSEFSLALSPADRGSLLHDALNILWSRIGDHKSLLAMTADGEKALAVEAAAGAISAFPSARRRLLGAAYWRLEGERMASLLGEWLAVEKQRGEFVVSQRELDVSLALGQLQLRLRVDRIDQLPDGSQVIIDYKSGVSRVQDWLGDRPSKPQLLLYGIAAPGAAAALAFGQIRPRDSKFVGLGRVGAAAGIGTDIAKAVGDSMEADDWESLNRCWQQNLERLAAEFVAGQAQVDPLATSSCAWCGLQSLCRVAITEQAPT